MAQDNNSYGSNPKPTEYVKAWGQVANIADPDNSGRVQIRFIGMEGNEGTIPDDQLGWYDTEIQGSQIKGVGASHKYSVGSYVKLENVGGKWTVTGAGTSVGNGSPSSDTFDTKDGGYPKSARKSSPGLEDVKLNVEGVDLLGNLQDKIQFTSESLLKYAADEANGSAAKFKDLPNIGAFMFNGAQNPIDAIRSLDPGNLSGAITTALNLVTNFASSGLGKLSSMLGAGALTGALSQLQSQFGPPGLLADASRAINTVTRALNNINNLSRNLTPQNLIQNAAMIENLPMMLSNPSLNIPVDMRSSVELQTRAITASLSAGDTAGAIARMSQLNASLSGVSSHVTPMAAKLKNTPINPLSAAQLAANFAGNLNKIEIPKLPEIGLSKGSFPKIPTFTQEQEMVAKATAAALSSAMSQAINNKSQPAQKISNMVKNPGTRII